MGAINNLVVENLCDIKSSRAQTAIVATTASTYTLSVGHEMNLIFTGSTSGQILNLGDATQYQVGHCFRVDNNATAIVTAQNGAAALLALLRTNTRMTLVLQSNSTAAGVWSYHITSASELAGVYQFFGSYGANALTGRYLEIFPSLASDEAPFLVVRGSVLVGVSIGCVSSSTGTAGIFRTTDLVTPVFSISLTAQTSNSSTNLNVAVAALDRLAVRVTSGTIQKPFMAVYLSGT